MKFLVFTDLHIHDYRQFNNGHQRLQNCLSVIEDMYQIADDNGIEHILFAGDLYDTQRALLTNVVNETIKTFLKMVDEYPHIRFYMITGNHDQASKSLYGNEAISALDHIQELAPNRLILLDNKLRLIESSGPEPDVTLSGIPYYEYPEHYSQALDDAVGKLHESPLHHNILLIHQTPKDVNGNPMIPTDTDPADPRYERYDKVFCGHIHWRVELTDNFTQVGSPIHRDLGDKGQTKGYSIYDTVTGEDTFYHLDGYPEYREMYQSEYDQIEEKSGEFYTVVKPDPEMVLSEQATVEEFNVDLTEETLVENYWREATSGKDEALLKAGLDCIKK